MITNSNIDRIVNILKKEIRSRPLPAVEKVTYEYRTPWHIMVSTMLSVRTKDENTIKVSRDLFKKVKDNDALMKINLKSLQRLIFASGFYKNKSNSN